MHWREWSTLIDTKIPTAVFAYISYQGGKRLGDETSSPLFKQCVMQRRTGTTALSALPVRLVAGKIYLITNRKSHFLSLFFSQRALWLKRFFFHNPGSQLKMCTFACILVNLFHCKLPKNWGCRMPALAAKHDMVVYHRLFYKGSKFLHPKSYVF